MRLRKTYIVEDQVLDAAGTVIKDLDFTDPISEIIIGVTGKKHDHTNINPLVARGISKIEIVDGTDVLFSMNMEQAQALQLAQTKRMPFNTMTCNQYSTNLSQVVLAFGRSRSDNEWALDPTKYSNPQIKITYAFTEGASNWKDNEQKITITAIVQENSVGRPTSFLMGKEIYSWVKATSGDETIDMDRSYPYRLLLWGVKDATSPVWNELNKIKISCDMDKFVPINDTGEDLAHENATRTGLLVQQSEIIGAGADADINAYYPFSWNWGADIESWNTGGNCKVKRPYSGYITVRGAGAAHASAVPDDEALQDGQRVIVTGRGYELNMQQSAQFGNLEDSQEFFDPLPFKSVRLILTQGGGDELVSRVVTQQLRKY